MPANAFLDKGVILGFCFFTDPHHRVCRKYLFSNGTDYYASQEVEEVFENAKADFLATHRKAVLGHLKEVKAAFSGELSEADIEQIQDGIDREENAAWRYLLDFYEGKAGMSVYEATEELRGIVREMEQRAETRRDRLYSEIMSWLCIGNHQSVRQQLQRLRRQDEEDFRICMDAHDVATTVPGETELATTNPAEFGDEEIRREVLDATAIDSIRLVFVSRDYSASELP